MSLGSLRLAGWIAPALLLAASVSHAQDVTPRTSPPDTLPGAARMPLLQGERWSLARAVATALERNVDVRVARARTRQASGSALAAWSNILPSISLGASESRFWPQEDKVFQPIVVNDTTLVSGFLTRRDERALQASLETNLISLPGISEKRRQDHLKRSAEHGEAETRNGVVFRVKEQYFAVVKAVRLAEVARESERLARDEEARAEALFQVGTVARGDVLKARARRAETQLERIRADHQAMIQTERLKQIVGVPPATSMAVEPVLEEAVVMPDSAASVRSALERRPLLDSAEATERAARSGVFGSWTQRLPRLTGSYTALRVKTSDAVDAEGLGEVDIDDTSTQRQGELRLSMPLFDGLAIEGNIRRAKGILQEAEADRRQRELDVAVEVQQAWLALREAVERIAVAREGLASAEEDYNFSNSRYELGAGTYLDLLTAQVNLERARQSHVEALADARVAEAELERAVGDRRY